MVDDDDDDDEPSNFGKLNVPTNPNMLMMLHHWSYHIPIDTIVLIISDTGVVAK